MLNDINNSELFHVLDTIEQGTEEWLQLRRKHVTATDAGKILEEVPANWGTPYSCWLDKLMDRRVIPNEAMKRGTELEPVARDLYNKRTGIDYQPACVISKEHEFMMSSLDGLSPDCKSAVEFKCPGANTHNKAKSGTMPKYYNSQMQHHMSILGLEKMDYVSYFEGELVILTIHRDQEYINLLVEKERNFYDCLLNFNEPESALEELVVENEVEARMLKFNLESALEKKRELDKIIDDCKEKLKKIANGRNIKIENMTIKKQIRQGSIRYNDIPELSGVNLNKYRKEPTEFYRFSL